MNAVYGLGPRLAQSLRWGKEMLAGDEFLNKQLPDFYWKPEVVTPRVLKDGADSVGALGALNRVYLNIGLFSEEWLLHFRPFVGGRPITPIRIADAEKKSIYWQATEARSPAMASFLIAAGRPDKLSDAPGGDSFLTKDPAVIERGKEVFADRCARCHSSTLPAPAPAMDVTAGCGGSNYLSCWNAYWSWTKTDAFKSRMYEIVKAPDFLKDNFLSTDLRVPVTLLQTQACSPLASNAIAGNIWDNFSSRTYKDMPSVGEITVHNPFTGEARQWQMPGGGRGYIRPASLISLWSTAPFLQNNTLGNFKWTGSVSDRMASFDDAIEKLLWPEKRPHDTMLGSKVPGWIDRTTAPSYFTIPPDKLPGFAMWTIRQIRSGWIDREGNLRLGPIPAGTPVNLISNLELIPDGASFFGRMWHFVKLAPSGLRLIGAFWSMPDNATEEQQKKAFEGVLEPLLAFSKCPDFIVNRGHYFGTDQFSEEGGLNDQQKRDLIEFLKTL
jgi:mono/diheme cytochrome c family protein